MMATALYMVRLFVALVLCVCTFPVLTEGQQQPKDQEQPDDVLRINADLAQTDVMVFDKQGRFVDNLTRDQFELKVDGKTKPIAFFEFLKAGSPNEDSQLAAARGDTREPISGQQPGTVVPLDRGRLILFFVDDLHLAVDSMQRTQELLEQFLEKNFGQNDRAAITTGSGQLGFLEQITSDKAVLLKAIKRLHYQPSANRDSERPPMTASQALSISRFDMDVTDFFVDRFMADNPGFPRNGATEYVRKRAIVLLQQTSAFTKNSLQSLYSLMRFTTEVPERKLLFFISDGFLIDDQTSNVTATLRRITDAAARAGVVVYSIDARGVSTGIPDPTMDVGADPGERLTRTSFNEITSTQAPLRSLSSDTGGRALLNTNGLADAASEALKETSAYYVLAWRPNSEQEANKFRRIEVSVIGRPELAVRTRQGFIERDAKSGNKSNPSEATRKQKPASADDTLLEAIQSRFPLRAIPTSVFVSFANDKEIGSYVTISMEMNTDNLSYVAKGGKPSAVVNVAGIVFDDQNKSAASFKAQLTVNPPVANAGPAQRVIAFNHQTRLKPGLYQVRVAASDSQSSIAGSAVQWIEVPDLTSNQLTLSSVTIGERPIATNASSGSPGSESVFLSISRRFARRSILRFFTNIYNATIGTGANESPDVVLQVQVFRDNQPIMTTELSKVETLGIEDFKRLPYAAEISLNTMPPGRYRLQVTVIDRKAKTSATQYVTFEVG